MPTTHPSQSVYLSLGSNLGNREANLNRAVRMLRDPDRVMLERISSCFETEPVGYRDQPWFLNLALEIRTSLTPRQVLDRCKRIERSMGRVPTFQGAPRVIDLDILLYGKRIVDDLDLTIPHPRMARRRFVLEPLSEIAPDTIHPVLGMNLRSILLACPDSATVRRHPARVLL
jgi:2-amino-4-hydroxy-6-hydroxymethyldihydropteridine diphosphokinase